MLEKKHSFTKTQYVIEFDGKFMKRGGLAASYLPVKQIGWTANPSRAALFTHNPKHDVYDALRFMTMYLQDIRYQRSGTKTIRQRLEKAAIQLTSATVRKVEITVEETYRVKGVNA